MQTAKIVSTTIRNLLQENFTWDSTIHPAPELKKENDSP